MEGKNNSLTLFLARIYNRGCIWNFVNTWNFITGYHLRYHQKTDIKGSMLALHPNDYSITAAENILQISPDTLLQASNLTEGNKEADK